jgi:hypothetical protein
LIRLSGHETEEKRMSSYNYQQNLCGLLRNFSMQDFSGETKKSKRPKEELLHLNAAINNR